MIGLGAVAIGSHVNAAPARSADGIYSQPWIKRAENMALHAQEAKETGKPLVILWERPVCHFCKKLHESTLSRDDVKRELMSKITLIQLNMVSDEQIIGLLGEPITERQLSRQMGILGSPTMQFMKPDPVPGKPRAQEIKRIYGYHGKELVMDMTEYVSSGAWENMFFTIWKKKYKG